MTPTYALTFTDYQTLLTTEIKNKGLMSYCDYYETLNVIPQTPSYYHVQF